jgi:resolvase domain protein
MRYLYSAAKMHLDFIGKEDIIGNVCYATMTSYRADAAGEKQTCAGNGKSGTSHTGDKHYYYKCAGAKRKLGCKKKSVKKDFIERAAVILTVNRVLRDEESAALPTASLPCKPARTPPSRR